jgi:hypothetical protein
MVSGVGPADTLQALNIPIIADRPGVGQRMQVSNLLLIKIHQVRFKLILLRTMFSSQFPTKSMLQHTPDFKIPSSQAPRYRNT